MTHVKRHGLFIRSRQMLIQASESKGHTTIGLGDIEAIESQRKHKRA
jgi:hypothetical protein